MPTILTSIGRTLLSKAPTGLRNTSGLALAVACVASGPRAFAQVTPPAAIAAAPAAAIPTDVAAPTANVDAIASDALNGMEETRKVYETARKLLGGEHVVLTAMAYVTRSCSNGQRYYAAKACLVGPASGGVAGVVALPLWGLGGGHGSDWFPVLHTEAETQSFERFQSRVDDYLSAVSLVTDRQGKLSLSQPESERLRQELLRTVAALTRRATEDDASYFEEAKRVRVCVQRLLRKQDLLHADLSDSALTVPNEDDLGPECDGVIGVATKGLKEAPARFNAALQTVRRYLDDINKKSPLQRHEFLIGPAVGFPLTENPTKQLLWGGAAEFGWRDGLRMGAGAGWVLSYDAPIAPMSGFYVGVSLSGQFGDDLVHYLSKVAN